MPAGLWGGRQAKLDVKAGKIDVVLNFPAYYDRSSDKNYVKWHLQYLNLFAVKSAVMQNIAFFLPFTQGQSHDHVLICHCCHVIAVCIQKMVLGIILKSFLTVL